VKAFLILHREAPNVYKAVGALFLPDEVPLIPDYLVFGGGLSEIHSAAVLRSTSPPMPSCR
jgi:hypothetical protein